MAIETDTTVTVLDHIDKITVPGNVFHEPVNEYWALICLQHGMEFLYHQAHLCDQVVKEQVNPDGNMRFFGGGNFPAFNQIPKTLLTCGFHWYAISACQYVKTVGAIAHKLDPNRPLPKDYAKNIIPKLSRSAIKSLLTSRGLQQTIATTMPNGLPAFCHRLHLMMIHSTSAT